VVRGVRNAARLYLTYGPGGVLQLQVENTAALQQPAKPDCSNSTQPLNGGWPSYEFDDGSSGFSGILRLPNGEPSVDSDARSIADTPNRLSVEFQDALNGYQQDSYELVDPDDVALAGQEVSMTLSAMGLPNYDQAARILKFNLDKSVRGNTYIAFRNQCKSLWDPARRLDYSYIPERRLESPAAAGSEDLAGHQLPDFHHHGTVSRRRVVLRHERPGDFARRGDAGERRAWACRGPS